jgi:hypothetical protein
MGIMIKIGSSIFEGLGMHAKEAEEDPKPAWVTDIGAWGIGPTW